MERLVLFFLGNDEYFGYSCSFPPGALWELIIVMRPHFFTGFNLFIWSEKLQNKSALKILRVLSRILHKILLRVSPRNFLVNLFLKDFWIYLDSPSNRSTFSTYVGGCKNTAIAEKREENPEILTKQGSEDFSFFVFWKTETTEIHEKSSPFSTPTPRQGQRHFSLNG